MDESFMVGIDVGGTFTDGVAVNSEGNNFIAKASSTKEDPSIGVMNTLTKLAKQAGMEVEEFVPLISKFVYGTTVATNSLLERRGSEIALITTRGFKDQLNLRRIWRGSGYNLRAVPTESYVSRHRTYEVTERVDYKGNILIPLMEEDVVEAAGEIKKAGIKSVAVSLLFAFINPDHEKRIREILYREIPDLQVSISSEICPEIREYERTSTVVINAYLTQTVQKHLESFEKELIDLGLKPTMLIMQSGGGVTASKYVTDKPVNIFLSGPAGGVVASSYIGHLDADKPDQNILAVDMGGTSFDITLLTGGKIPLSMRSIINGWHIITPTIDIQTIGAGGGSIAWVDAGNGLHVGPQSAGANPGPVSYMKGGEEPTVTDADLVLGYIDPNYFLGGEIKLNPDKANEAIGRVSKRIGLSVLETASGIYRIVNENMLGGMRVSTLQSGHDPRDYILYVFGGAAPVHLPDFATELGINHIVIPRDAAVFSALGLTISEIRFDLPKNLSCNTADISFDKLREEYDKLKEQGNRLLEDTLVEKENRYYLMRADMKYPGEFNEFIIDIPENVKSIEDIAACFAKFHKEKYGYAEDSMPDIINIRLSAFGRMRKPKFILNKNNGESSLHALKGTRQAYYHELNSMVDTSVFDGQLMFYGNRVTGPAIIELPTTTIVIRPRQKCYVDEYDNFNILCGGEKDDEHSKT